MEINNFPPAASPSLRAPSAVDDGDAGPNSPYYRRRQKKKKTHQDELAEDELSGLDGSSSHIDIRV